MVTWRFASRDPDRSRSWHQYVGAHYLKYDWRYALSYDHVTLNFYTYRSSIYIRIEISYECYRWQWTDSVFFRTLSCFSKHIPDNAGSACTQPLFTRRKRCPNGKLLELISVEFLQTKVICITQTYELEYWRLWTFIYARTYKKICADMQTTQK